MTLDRSWLLATARAEREALGRRIQYTPPDRWEAESVLPTWRNRDIVAHLAAMEVAAAASIAGEAPSEFEEYMKSLEGERLTLDGFNEWSVLRRIHDPFRRLVSEWGRAADLLLSRASKITEEDWGSRKVWSVAGHIRVGYLIQSRVMEWWLHGEDLSEGVGLPPRIEHGPIHCVNDLAIRMIPYALGLAGLSFRGRTVAVELHAAGGGRWLRSLTPKETPAPGRKTDAVIEGRAHAFALVAGRRVPAEHYLAEGILQVGGDAVLGETILEHLRAFTA